MKKYTLKSLTSAVTSVMALLALSAQSVKAADTEIYQAPKKGNVTLMLMLDISGSMAGESYLSDYALKYTAGGLCQDNKIRSEVMHGGIYTRKYCVVPENEVDNPNNYTLYSEHTYYPKVAGEWVKGAGGCEKVGQEYRCYERFSRLQDALYDTLMGNPSKGITPIAGDKVIGLSTLGIYLRDLPPQRQYVPYPNPTDPYSSYSAPYWRDFGAVHVPARRLDADVNGKTQREILVEAMGKLQPLTATPTARSYAETAAYLLGTTTVPTGLVRRELYEFKPNEQIQIGTRMRSGIMRFCDSWNANGECQSTRRNRRDYLNDIDMAMGQPSRALNVGQDNDTRYFYGYMYPNATGDALGRYELSTNNVVPYHAYNVMSGFIYSANDTKKADGLTYQAPATLINQQDPQCNGQGIYVLSDGSPSYRPGEEQLMKEVLGNTNFTCGEDEWNCLYALSQHMLNKDKNPMGISYKTAMVGFARNYIAVPQYNPSKTIAENTKDILGKDYDESRLFSQNTLGLSSEQKAALWGIRAGGGWYSGVSSQSVVDSINSFIATLITDIPTTTTGQPFIPIDPLDPLTRMSDAYYGSFIPKINVNNSFWLGDMNKYKIKSSILYDKDDKKLFDTTTGLVSPNVIGFWSDNSKNGMTALLPLRTNARPVFTNHTGSSNTALTKVTLDALFDGGGALVGDTANHNAWLNLLGYDVTGTITSKTAPELTNAPELRQVGAVMHSTPIVLTQSGTPFDANSREDYVLFGSTQGILHVVDSKTGVEKVAFVPKEMMTNQKQSFQSAGTTSGGLLWGIDGPWTAYTQYVPNTGGGVTVKGAEPTSSSDLTGKGVQWVYGGLRMGGRSYYALDLSDIDNPKIKFHIDPASAPAGSPLSFMGQSWSKPTLGFVNWEGDYFNPTTNTTERAVKRRLVMFVGGGYDMGYETRTYNQTNGTGGGVYMFDAHNGELLWWGSSHANTSTTAKYTNNANLKYSVVSNISTFDRNNDGLVDNLIFGDLGGQVFRVDLDNSGSATPTNRVVRLYNGHQAGGLSPRFYESPSLSAHKDGVAGTFGVISVASGNRSSPLAEGAESARDMLVVLYDHDVLKGTATVTDAPTDNLLEIKKSDMSIETIDESKDRTAIEIAKDARTKHDKLIKDATQQKGWKYYLSQTAGKLKGYSSPRVVDNFLFLTTYTPDGGTVQQNSCNAGILGGSYQEIFCMPFGVCTTEKQVKNLNNMGDITTNDGSQYRTQIGVGIVQAAVGTKDASGASSNENRIVAPKVDCTANPNNPACLTELSSITNKPTRWYEKESRN